jgi:hypothetical protein
MWVNGSAAAGLIILLIAEASIALMKPKLVRRATVWLAQPATR